MTEIRTLIDEIKSNRMRLPEMQRAYVWKSTQVRDLLDSLYRKYPTGTILRWETTQKVPTRDFAVSQDDTKYESYYLLLDGQQRLTSLKAILCGEPVNVRGRKRAIDIYFNLDHPDKLENTKVATDDDNETEFEEDDDIKITSDEEENNLLDSGRWDLFLIYLETSSLGDIPCRKFIKTAPKEYIIQYIKRYKLYSDSLRELILLDDYDLLKMVIEHQIFCVGEQRNLLRNGSDKLLETFFQEYCFAPSVEAELLQSGRKRIIAAYLRRHKVWPDNRHLLPSKTKENPVKKLWHRIINLFS